ncbi:hypothetical protein HBI23_256040 [Parastagonospora nodorum]|nr:hypothetical protein HBI23_256040 [Parastagonospora nodorum]KAH5618977.1 hypothetical protein HBI51_252840 [Parastagonospora nodorum]KAH5982744.1 hypothetical protein HBI84_250450 [Parastagonospora nodorum]KAH6132290.1 hypothetical protein HBI68_255620 [Parastagonospora nodorum]KAH6380459.1 hypothetical protein HBI08_238900 [Parastagonospora nodorum]
MTATLPVLPARTTLNKEECYKGVLQACGAVESGSTSNPASANRAARSYRTVGFWTAKAGHCKIVLGRSAASIRPGAASLVINASTEKTASLAQCTISKCSGSPNPSAAHHIGILC